MNNMITSLIHSKSTCSWRGALSRAIAYLSFIRTTAIITLVCFLYTSVVAQGLYAMVEDRHELKAISGVLDGLIVPTSVGRITEGKCFGSGKVVVNIQDLHCHPEVQHNISKILSLLDARYKLKKVYVEGASGAVDTSWLGDIKDKDLKNEIVEALVDQGKLTGTEHYSITSGRPDVLVGLEDEKLYKENLLRLNKILENKERYDQELRTLNKELSIMKARYFNEKNKRFEKFVESYHNGEMDAGKYYKLLRRYTEKINENRTSGIITNSNFATYKNINAYLQLLEQGQQLKYGNIARQMQEFVSLLKQKLPYSVYNSLLDRTDNFTKLDTLYVYLSKIATEYHLDLRYNFPQLEEFFAYMETGQRINPLELVREEKKLVEEIRMGLSEDISELEVSFVFDFFSYFDDYVHNRLSAEDYGYFKDRFEQFRLLWSKYSDRDGLKDLNDDFSLLNEYYKVNGERNDCFIKTIEKAGEQQREAGKRQGETGGRQEQQAEVKGEEAGDPRKAIAALDKADDVMVVVTGGFHTEGLKALLAQRHISYLTITPNVTQDTKKSDLVYTELAEQQAKILQAALAPMLASVLIRIAKDPQTSPERLAAISGTIQYLLDGVLQGVKDEELQGKVERLFRSEDSIKKCFGELQVRVVKPDAANKEWEFVFGNGKDETLVYAYQKGKGEIRLLSLAGKGPTEERGRGNTSGLSAVVRNAVAGGTKAALDTIDITRVTMKEIVDPFNALFLLLAEIGDENGLIDSFENLPDNQKDLAGSTLFSLRDGVLHINPDVLSHLPDNIQAALEIDGKRLSRLHELKNRNPMVQVLLAAHPWCEGILAPHEDVLKTNGPVRREKEKIVEKVLAETGTNEVVQIALGKYLKDRGFLEINENLRDRLFAAIRENKLIEFVVDDNAAVEDYAPHYRLLGEIFRQLGEDLGRDFGARMQTYKGRQMSFFVVEMLQNAFSHGNQLDPSLPIYFHLDLQSPKISVYNIVQDNKSPSSPWERAKEAKLHGAGLGKPIMTGRLEKIADPLLNRIVSDWLAEESAIDVQYRDSNDPDVGLIPIAPDASDKLFKAEVVFSSRKKQTVIDERKDVNGAERGRGKEVLTGKSNSDISKTDETEDIAIARALTSSALKELQLQMHGLIQEFRDQHGNYFEKRKNLARMKEIFRLVNVQVLAADRMLETGNEEERRTAQEVFQGLLALSSREGTAAERDIASGTISELSGSAEKGNQLVLSAFKERLLRQTKRVDSAVLDALLDKNVSYEQVKKFFGMLKNKQPENDATRRLGYFVLLCHARNMSLLNRIIEDDSKGCLDLRFKLYAFSCLCKYWPEDENGRFEELAGRFLSERRKSELRFFILDLINDESWLPALYDNLLLQDEEAKTYVMAVFLVLFESIPSAYPHFTGNRLATANKISDTRLNTYWEDANSDFMFGLFHYAGDLHHADLFFQGIAHEVGHNIIRYRHAGLKKKAKRIYGVDEEFLADVTAFVFSDKIGLFAKEAFMEHVDYAEDFDKISRKGMRVYESHEGARAFIGMLMQAHRTIDPQRKEPDWNKLLEACVDVLPESDFEELPFAEILKKYGELAGRNIPESVLAQCRKISNKHFVALPAIDSIKEVLRYLLLPLEELSCTAAENLTSILTARMPENDARLPNVRTSAAQRKLPALFRSPGSMDENTQGVDHRSAIGTPFEFSLIARLGQVVRNSYTDNGNDVQRLQNVATIENHGVLFHEVALVLMTERSFYLDDTDAVYLTKQHFRKLDSPECENILRDILVFSRGYEQANVGSIRFVLALADYKARKELEQIRLSRLALPGNNLQDGEYWDLASGMNFAFFMNDTRQDVVYRVYDTSPFVVGYLAKMAELLGKRNISVMRQDVMTIQKPAAAPAVIRAKNVSSYVSAFAGKLAEMTGWIAPGGTLVVQNDAMAEQREEVRSAYSVLARTLAADGWGFSYTLGSDAKQLDTLLFSREKVATGQEWDDYVADINTTLPYIMLGWVLSNSIYLGEPVAPDKDRNAALFNYLKTQRLLNPRFPITAEHIDAVHRILTGGSVFGTVRSEALEECAAWLNGNERAGNGIPFALAGFRRLETGRPFAKADNLTARMLMNILLLRNGDVPVFAGTGPIVWSALATTDDVTAQKQITRAQKAALAMMRQNRVVDEEYEKSWMERHEPPVSKGAVTVLTAAVDAKEADGQRRSVALRTYLAREKKRPLHAVDLSLLVGGKDEEIYSDPLRLDRIHREKSSLDAAVRQGAVIWLDLSRFTGYSLDEKFRKVRENITVLAHMVAAGTGPGRNNTRFQFALEELVKNAFAHGSRLDFSLPIACLANADEGVMEVYDMGLRTEVARRDAEKMERAGISGKRRGLQIMTEDDKWQYERTESLKDPVTGEILGTRVTAQRPVIPLQTAPAAKSPAAMLKEELSREEGFKGFYELDIALMLEATGSPERDRFLEAVRNGKTIVVRFDGLAKTGDLAVRYGKASEAIVNCASDMIFGNGFWKDRVQQMRTQYALKEMMKNALVHGNKLACDLPVIVRVDRDIPRVDVYDTASARVPSPAETDALKKANSAGDDNEPLISGSGAGVNTIRKDGWEYTGPVPVTDARSGTKVGARVSVFPARQNVATAVQQPVDTVAALRAKIAERYGNKGFAEIDMARLADMLDRDWESAVFDAEESKLLEAINAGKIIVLDFSNLRGELADKYTKVANNAYRLADSVGYSAPFRRYNERVMVGLKEVVKNAFAHGNRLDFSLPVFIHADPAAVRFDVYDTASQREPTAQEKEALAADTTLAGRGVGKGSIRVYGWRYEEPEPVLVNGRTVGTKVSISLPLKGGFVRASEAALAVVLMLGIGGVGSLVAGNSIDTGLMIFPGALMITGLMNRFTLRSTGVTVHPAPVRPEAEEPYQGSRRDEAIKTKKEMAASEDYAYFANSKEMREILANGDLSNPGWLGELGEKIVQGYNGGRPLAPVTVVIAQDEENDAAERIQQHVRERTPLAGDDEYVYVTIIRPLPAGEGYECSAAVVKRSAAGTIPSVGYYIANKDDHDVLLLVRFSLTTDNGRPLVDIRDLGIIGELQGNGLFARFARVLSHHFWRGKAQGAFLSKAARTFFLNYFIAQERQAPVPGSGVTTVISDPWRIIPKLTEKGSAVSSAPGEHPGAKDSLAENRDAAALPGMPGQSPVPAVLSWEQVRATLEEGELSTPAWLGDLGEKIVERYGKLTPLAVEMRRNPDYDLTGALESLSAEKKDEFRRLDDDSYVYLTVVEPEIGRTNKGETWIEGYSYSIFIAKKSALTQALKVTAGGIDSAGKGILLRWDLRVQLSDGRAHIDLMQQGVAGEFKGEHLVSSAYKGFARFLCSHFGGGRIGGEFAHNNALYLFMRYFKNNFTVVIRTRKKVVAREWRPDIILKWGTTTAAASADIPALSTLEREDAAVPVQSGEMNPAGIFAAAVGAFGTGAIIVHFAGHAVDASIAFLPAVYLAGLGIVAWCISLVDRIGGMRVGAGEKAGTEISVSDRVRDVLVHGELSGTEWLGTLGEEIAGRYNGGKSLAAVTLVWDRKTSIEDCLARLPEQKRKEFEQVGKKEYLYVHIVTPYRYAGDDGVMRDDGYKCYTAISRKSEVAEAPFVLLNELDSHGGDILFLQRFVVTGTNGTPHVRLDQVGLYSALRGKGFFSSGHAGFARFIRRHFGRGKLSVRFADRNALELFIRDFDDRRLAAETRTEEGRDHLGIYSTEIPALPETRDTIPSAGGIISNPLGPFGSVTVDEMVPFFAVRNNTVLVNPVVYRLLSALPRWLQSGLLYCTGIVAHEQEHLAGNSSEVYAYGLYQVLPAFVGALLFGGAAVAAGLAGWQVALAGLGGIIVITGLTGAARSLLPRIREMIVLVVRTNPGAGALPGEMERRVTAIERYLQGTKRTEIVTLDLAAFSAENENATVQRSLEAVREGKVLALRLHDFPGNNLLKKYDGVASAASWLSRTIGAELAPGKGHIINFALAELIKNAFAHGNRLDFALPIYISIDAVTKTIEVYDMASNRILRGRERRALEEAKTLAGEGVGNIHRRQEGWSYERNESFRDPGTGAVLGTKAAVRMPREMATIWWPEKIDNATAASKGGRGSGNDALRKSLAETAEFHEVDLSVLLDNDDDARFEQKEFLQALRQGKTIVLWLRALKRWGNLTERYAAAADALINCALLLAGSRSAIYEDDPHHSWLYVLKEVLKNALVHGNRLDFDLPIIVRVDQLNRKAVIYDMASRRQLTHAEQEALGKSLALSGDGKGIANSIAAGWSYVGPVPVIDPVSGIRIGSNVTVSLKEKKTTKDDHIMIGNRDQVRDILINSELADPAWLGKLGEQIVQRYNGGKPLLPYIVDLSNGSDDEYRERLMKMSGDPTSAFGRLPDEAYVYLVIVKPAERTVSDGSSVTKCTVCVARKSVLAAAPGVNYYQINDHQGSVLLKQDFSIALQQGKVLVNINVLTVYRELMEKGLVSSVCKGFVRFLSRHFYPGKAKSLFVGHDNAMRLFENNFKNVAISWRDTGNEGVGDIPELSEIAPEPEEEKAGRVVQSREAAPPQNTIKQREEDLRQYLARAKGLEIGKIDLSEAVGPRDLGSYLKDGRALFELSVERFAEKYQHIEKHQKTYTAINSFAQALAQAMGATKGSDPYVVLWFGIAALLENALKHGNKLDYRLPLYVFIDSKEKKMEFYDLANPKEAEVLDTIFAWGALFGRGEALNILKEQGWKVDREEGFVDPGSEKVLGTRVLVSLPRYLGLHVVSPDASLQEEMGGAGKGGRAATMQQAEQQQWRQLVTVLRAVLEKRSNPLRCIPDILNAVTGIGKYLDAKNRWPELTGQKTVYRVFSKDDRQALGQIVQMVENGVNVVGVTLFNGERGLKKLGMIWIPVTGRSKPVQARLWRGTEQVTGRNVAVLYIEPLMEPDITGTDLVSMQDELLALGSLVTIGEIGGYVSMKGNSRAVKALCRLYGKKKVFGNVDLRDIGFAPSSILVNGTLFRHMIDDRTQRALALDGVAFVTDRAAASIGGNAAGAYPVVEDIDATDTVTLLRLCGAAVRQKKAEKMATGYRLVLDVPWSEIAGATEQLRDANLGRLADEARTSNSSICLSGLPKDALTLASAVRQFRSKEVELFSDYVVQKGAGLMQAGEEIRTILKQLNGLEIDLGSRDDVSGTDLRDWLAGIKRSVSPDAVIAVVLPATLGQEGKTICRSLNIRSVRTEIVGKEKKDISGEDFECIRIKLGDGAWENISSLRGTMFKIALRDLSAHSTLFGHSDNSLYLLFANIGLLKSLIKETPDTVYRAAQQYGDKDVPGAETWRRCKELFIRHGLEERFTGDEEGLLAAVAALADADVATLEKDLAALTGVPGLEESSAAGLTLKKLHAANDGSPAALRASAAKSCMLLKGLAERILVKENLARGGKNGFSRPSDALEFGKLLLAAEGTADRCLAADGNVPNDALADAASMLLVLGRFADAHVVLLRLGERLRTAAPNNGICALRFAALVESYGRRDGVDELIVAADAVTLALPGDTAALYRFNGAAAPGGNTAGDDARVVALLKEGSLPARAADIGAFVGALHRYGGVNAATTEALTDKAKERLRVLWEQDRSDSGALSELLRIYDLYDGRKTEIHIEELRRMNERTFLSMLGAA